ncbi:MAG: hypothetical protein ABL994_19240 [Verrucomicrobiales bacterium]
MKTPMHNPEDWTNRLIRLKRYETPGADYFERFLDDFHERQRVDTLRVSVRTLASDRFFAWWGSVSSGEKLAWASALVVLAGSLSFFSWGLLAQGESPERRPVDGPALAEVSLVREF